MNISTERRLLQIAIGAACLVPLSAGLWGAVAGVQFLGGGDINLDSHFRYLSGLLLGIGIYFLRIIPRVELQSSEPTILTLIVFIGGLGRLLGIFIQGAPGHGMFAALAMELLVTPALWFWQRSLSRRFLTL